MRVQGGSLWRNLDSCSLDFLGLGKLASLGSVYDVKNRNNECKFGRAFKEEWYGQE